MTLDNDLKNLTDKKSPIKKGTLVVLSTENTNRIAMWKLAAGGTLANLRLEYNTTMGPLLYLGYKGTSDSFFGDSGIRHHFLLAENVYYIDTWPVPRSWWTPEEFVGATFKALTN